MNIKTKKNNVADKGAATHLPQYLAHYQKAIYQINTDNLVQEEDKRAF